MKKNDTRHEPIVGVDIGPDYIRAVQLERKAPGYRLRNIGIAPTPEGSVKGGFIVDPKRVGREIKKLFRERRFDTDRVATAVRGRGVISRIITLPSMPQDRLGRLIETEVNRYILFSEQDKVVYYYPIEEFDEYDRRKVNVLLVVAQKSWCRSYYDAFTEAGLDLVGIDYSTFAILRELRNSSGGVSGGATMALALDCQGASLNIFHNDILRYTRQLRIDHDAGESLANGFKSKVLSEVIMSAQYYESQPLRGEALDRIIVSLGASGAEEVGKLVERSIENAIVENHSPFSNIQVAMNEFPSNIMEKIDSNFLTAVGVALREQEISVLPFQIDLLPAEVTEGRTLKQHFLWCLKFTALLAGLFVLAWQYVSYETSKIGHEKERIVALQLNPQTTELQKLSIMNSKTSELNPLDTAAPITKDMTGLMEEVKKLMPKNAQLTSMTFEDPGKIEFSGIAESGTTVLDFQSALENTGAFGEVQPGPRTPTTLFGKSMVKFVIRCRYLKAI